MQGVRGAADASLKRRRRCCTWRHRRKQRPRKVALGDACAGDAPASPALQRCTRSAASCTPFWTASMPYCLHYKQTNLHISGRRLREPAPPLAPSC